MGNVRLLFWGVLLGLLSALYPRLPLYLPVLSGRLPFLPTEHRDLLTSPSGKLWAQTLHQYQASVPVPPNHEHSKQAEWEAELERQLRFGSKEGGRELEKEYKRQLREVERRAEHAGAENLVREVLPVYFVEHGTSRSSRSPSAPAQPFILQERTSTRTCLLRSEPRSIRFSRRPSSCSPLTSARRHVVHSSIAD
jgi:hypothetical protein